MPSGKKVLFVGNSYTYYGNAVNHKGYGVLTQEERSGDQGWFYQLCKAKGTEVSVTNWTFGGHTFSDLFTRCEAGRSCNGVCHHEYLTDRSFDYVVLQEAGNIRSQTLSPEAFLQQVAHITTLFKAANPQVKFLFLVHHRAHERNFDWLSALPELEKQGIRVVDWGKMVWDIISGLPVPGATLPFDKNSFIVCQSEKDGFHPNLLTGYLTALMTYCAITGERATGQPYDFCGGFENYAARYYTWNGATTNFPAIFASEETMLALQRYIDEGVLCI